MNEETVRTKHGEIALQTAGDSGPTLLFVHGNSASKKVWRKQFESELTAKNRLIAIDLPGHGGSSYALDPEASYCMAGYADAVIAVLAALQIGRVVIVGWSLGGHVAIEMVPHFSGLAGMVLTGTPPIHRTSMDDINAGFYMNETTALAGQEVWNAEEAGKFSGTALQPDTPAPDWVVKAALRTDGRARTMMFGAFVAGQGGDQAEILANTNVPTAVINGADEPFINNDFIVAAAYGNLWRGQVQLLDGLGHAPFWQAPVAYNGLLQSFVDDMPA
jgi:pimeloyl-ACP methyl ester carboxylesterase